jgi:hypothetical protein
MFKYSKLNPSPQTLCFLFIEIFVIRICFEFRISIFGFNSYYRKGSGLPSVPDT